MFVVCENKINTWNIKILPEQDAINVLSYRIEMMRCVATQKKPHGSLAKILNRNNGSRELSGQIKQHINTCNVQCIYNHVVFSMYYTIYLDHDIVILKRKTSHAFLVECIGVCVCVMMVLHIFVVDILFSQFRKFLSGLSINKQKLTNQQQRNIAKSQISYFKNKFTCFLMMTSLPYRSKTYIFE